MSKVFVVLGMHRTATSLIAKGLAMSGINMGENLLPPSPSNPFGHWEDPVFVELNRKILIQAGGNWDKPPSEKKILESGYFFSKEICGLIRSKEKNELWGWKDPRTTLTIKCYLPYLRSPHFISCFRNIDEIAESLKKRNNFTIEKGLQLASEYNVRLLKFLKEWEKKGRYLEERG